MTLVELLIAAAVVAVIGIGAGTLYVSARNAMDLSTAESYVQRQGNLLEEEVVRQVSRANSLQVAECRPSGVTLAAGKSIIYNLRVQNAGTLVMEDETWCLFEHQLTGAPTQMLRCRVAGLTPPQDCTDTPVNFILWAPLRTGHQLRVSNTTFALASIVCGASSVPCATVTTADVRFRLELANAAGLLTAPRDFAFNVAIRN